MATITINRAPVLTLWATVVARRMGFRKAEALSLAKVLAGLNAQAKGRRLGFFKPHKQTAKEAAAEKHGEEFWVEPCGRPVPAKNTNNGVRAVKGDELIQSDGVQRYLESKFGDDLDRVTKAFEQLVKAYRPKELADAAYSLYEEFRPKIPSGKKGWGAKGTLDLKLVARLATRVKLSRDEHLDR